MQNAATSNATADNLAVLIDMGFTEQQAREALYRAGNLENAIAILLNDQVQPSPPSSPGVSRGDTSDDETHYATNPRSMQFIINTGHPHLTFSACLLHVAKASFDLYDQIMANRSQLLSFKTWDHHSDFRQIFECNNGNQLRELNQKLQATSDDDKICSVLLNDSKYDEPVCLAIFGISTYLEQYTSHLTCLRICPRRFLLDDEEESKNNEENNNQTTKKQ